MAELLKGKPVSDKLTEVNIEKVNALKAKGINPCLAIVRLGEDGGDIAYERGAMKKAEATGIEVKSFALPLDTTEDELAKLITDLNNDDAVHGVLMMRPLPKHIDEKKICNMLAPEKDMDGITEGSLAAIFMDMDRGFPPCTAEAVMEMLHFYEIPISERKAVVLGRSLVIGKPVAMMLMREGATVTICHSKSSEMTISECGGNADILVSAVGKPNFVRAKYAKLGRTVIDVGINVDEDGNIVGDVNFPYVSEVAGYITPVPGGVGSVTTAILMKHVVTACERL